MSKQIGHAEIKEVAAIAYKIDILARKTALFPPDVLDSTARDLFNRMTATLKDIRARTAEAAKA